MHAQHQRRLAAVGLAAATALVLAGCAGGDPLAEESEEPGSGSSETIVVGSQDYDSNAIIAEIYAQALENAGFDVERQFNIGQREAYFASIESGEIDLFPEYSGNTLRYFDEDASATSAEDVYSALTEALPASITALQYAEATDEDTYTVTADFAAENDLTTIADLAGLDGPVTVGGPPEFEVRDYGPVAVGERYGIDFAFEATGPTTLESLQEGQIDVGNIFTANPVFLGDELVTLEDPDNVILASNVVPLASSDIADEIADVIDAISAALTAEGLLELNQQSADGDSADDIATAWLTEQGLI